MGMVVDLIPTIFKAARVNALRAYNRFNAPNECDEATANLAAQNDIRNFLINMNEINRRQIFNQAGELKVTANSEMRLHLRFSLQKAFQPLLSPEVDHEQPELDLQTVQMAASMGSHIQEEQEQLKIPNENLSSRCSRSSRPNVCVR